VAHSEGGEFLVKKLSGKSDRFRRVSMYPLGEVSKSNGKIKNPLESWKKAEKPAKREGGQTVGDLKRGITGVEKKKKSRKKDNGNTLPWKRGGAGKIGGSKDPMPRGKNLNGPTTPFSERKAQGAGFENEGGQKEEKEKSRDARTLVTGS